MLNKKEIEKAISQHQLIQGYMSLEKQLTPNGIDLTVGAIFKFDSAGAVDFSNKERVIPNGQELKPAKKSDEDKYGWWHLKPGAYKVKTNETVNLPNTLVAFAYPRTSLLRMGVFAHNGVWDAGFKGKGEFILVVSNPAGVKVKENARMVQLVFTRVEQTESYDGIYKDLK